MKLNEISVFYPVYNEESNLEELITNTINVLPKFAERFEIIIVNDGSQDKTYTIAESFAKKYENVRCVHHVTNRGYGAALKTGFSNARFEYVFFSDADNQFDLMQLSRLVEILNGADVAVGYRIKRNDPWYRIMNAKAYNILVRILFGLTVRDIDCAFKIIKKDVLNKISLTSESQFLSAEFLIKANKSGYNIKEVGVDHFPRVSGKPTGNNIKCVIKSFVELFSLYKELKNYS